MKAINQKWIDGFVLLLTAIILSTLAANAQENYRQGASNVTVSGTSTMKDWTMSSNEALYTIAFKSNSQGDPVGLSSLIVTIPIESLKSGDSSVDEVAYSALKTEASKFITFQLLSAKMVDGVIRLNGKLKIAGVSRVVDLEATYILCSDHSIQIRGSKEIDMRAFHVEPPSFMFGSAKVGEKIIVSFTVTAVPKALTVLSATKTEGF